MITPSTTKEIGIQTDLSLPISTLTTPSPLITKIYSYAKEFFSFLLKAYFILMHSNIFATGFLIGLIWSQKTEEIIQKIKVTAWTTWIGFAKFCIIAAITLPAAYIVCGAICGATTGRDFYQAESLSINHQRK